MIYAPWYVAGPTFAVLVAVLYLLTNKRLGVSGSYLQAAFVVQGRGADQPWRLWFLGGLMSGAAVASAIANGGYALDSSYGQLGQVVSPSALPFVLLGGGALIGYGARWAGGCTSGHGLSGCSSLSAGSLATSVTFFAVAVVTTWVLHLATRGAL